MPIDPRILALMQQQDFGPGPQDLRPIMPAGGALEPEYMPAPIKEQATQEQVPSDFWARVAQGGGQPFRFDPGRKPTGLEAVLAVLAGLANAKTGQAARRIGEVEERNKEARAAASRLAEHRWKTYAADRAAARANRLATIRAATRISPEERAFRTEAGRRRAETTFGPSASELRAEAAAERAAAAAERAARMAEVNNTQKLIVDYRNDKAVQAYQFIHSNLLSAKESAKLKNGVGDVTLIFAYGRAREPENPNVLREGEFAVASQAAGQFESLKSMPKRFFQGDRLTEIGRTMILNQLLALERSRRPAFDQANAQYKALAKTFGVKPDLFIREVESSGPAEADLDYIKSLGLGGPGGQP